MEGRALRILLGLLIAAVVLFWAVRPKRAKVAVIESGILPPGADARVEGVTLLQSGDKGDLALTAHDAQWSRETETFFLNTVDIRFIGTGSNGAPAPGGHITSERGQASQNGHEFALEGRVVAEAFDGYRLETSDVRYDHTSREAKTEAPVTLLGPGIRVTGRGARLDYEKQRVEIRGRVRAHLEPSTIEENVPEGLQVPLP